MGIVFHANISISDEGFKLFSINEYLAEVEADIIRETFFNSLLSILYHVRLPVEGVFWSMTQ